MFAVSTRSSRPRCRPAPTATSPATSRWRTASSPARRKADLPMFLGAYPITPASDILHELSKHKRFGVTTFQAEDEIAGVGAALGATFAGVLGVTTTSGPGVALKAETIGLAVMTELPLRDRRRPARRAHHGAADQDRAGRPAAGDVRPQRRGAGPGRRAQSPADCFDTAIEAIRIAVKYRTPVILLSDGYIANGAEPWQVPDLADLPPIDPEFATGPNHETRPGTSRLPALPARPGDAGPAVGHPRHARARAPDRRHREGRGHGNVSYDPANHDEMVRTRQAKVDGIVRHPAAWRSTTPAPPARRASVLVLGWGSTYGPITAAVPPGPQGRPTSPRRTCATSTRSRKDLGEVLKPLRPRDRPGDEPRPARDAAARQVPRRRARLQPGPRPAAEGRRARRGDHRPDHATTGDPTAPTRTLAQVDLPVTTDRAPVPRPRMACRRSPRRDS